MLSKDHVGMLSKHHVVMLSKDHVGMLSKHHVSMLSFVEACGYGDTCVPVDHIVRLIKPRR